MRLDRLHPHEYAGLDRQQEVRSFEARRRSHEQAWLEDLAANAMSLNRNLQVHPEWPQIYARSGGPMFWLLENLTAQGLTTELLPALENFRSGNLSYLMLTSPPRPTAEEAGAAAELLRKEGELLEELKGCYFCC